MTKLLATDGQGERLDRFELIAELASGGMATVYLARLGGVAGFQRLVAIKRLHPHLAKDKEFIEMFLDEARLAARIHHPNVVPIVEVGATERGYYLVMEYIEGDTLARLFARSAQAQKKIPPEVGIRVVLDTLAGLHAAHELRDDAGNPLDIVHRDVSPQNILVGIDGTSRITDFGVARATSRLATTRSGQLKGKLAYMAPEQARGGHIDRRADLFAVGIVLWETLAFKRLFKGDQEAETLNKVLYDPIPNLRTVAPTVPASLAAVAMKALEREPDKRFASAAEFADELERAAKSFRSLGSVRDVASCVESVMGQEIGQQREAVRAWLARSEPSAVSKSPHSIPGGNESVTRVEVGRSSRSPSSPSHPSYGSSPSGVTGPHLPPGHYVPQAPASQPGSPHVPYPPPSTPGHVSSVSQAAVIPLPPPPPYSAGALPAPAPQGSRIVSRLAWAAALLGLGGAVTFGVMHLRDRTKATAGGGTTIEPATANTNASTTPTANTTANTIPSGTTTANTSATATPTDSTPVASAEPAPPATVVAGKAKSRPRVVPSAKPIDPKPPGTAATQPTAPATAPSQPDDISHNPYR